jgi:Tol biopolymer transport system component
VIDQQSVERAAERFRAPEASFDRLLQRRGRMERNRRIRAGVLGIGVMIAVGWLGINAIRSSPPVPADDRSTELGVFAPVAGRILYVNDRFTTPDGGYEDGLWAVEPGSPEDPTEGPIVADEIVSDLVQLSSVDATPLGWSRDGTELLLLRRVRGERVGATAASGLSILRADGSETRVATDPMATDEATISPDGSRVVFAGPRGALYAVDADGGPPTLLLEAPSGLGGVGAPTFSPDGTQIAYVVGGGDHDHHVWVVNADGSDAHEIVFNEWTAPVGHVEGLAWSPAGDRIALGLIDGPDPAIYMFAPDGSDFTQVIPGGARPYWSPDGSRIAYTIWGSGSAGEAYGPAGLAIADADGSNVREFGFAASGPWHPAASTETVETTPVPSGSSALAYGVDGDVFLADADGANAVRIADGAPVDSAEECAPGEERADYIVFGTAWSPDGRYLAYWDRGCPWQVRDDPEGAWGIVRITDAAGNLVASFPGQGWTISWSPDSTRVAVMDVWAPEGQVDATIGVYGLDGTRQAALTVPSALLTPQGDYSPVWTRDGASILVPDVQVPLDGGAPTPLPDELDGGYSPDGSRVAYVDLGSLVVDDSAGSDAQKPAGPGEFWDLAWSPNGDLVAFEGDGTDLFVRDVATGADTPLLDVTRQEQRLHVIEFTPDGDRILFTRSDADGGPSSLWSIGVDGSDLRRLLDGIDWADLRP